MQAQQREPGKRVERLDASTFLHGQLLDLLDHGIGPAAQRRRREVMRCGEVRGMIVLVLRRDGH